MQDRSMLPVVSEIFCGIHGTQFDKPNFDIVGTFKNISDSSQAANSKQNQ
jgi:hypothetical protein